MTRYIPAALIAFNALAVVAVTVAPWVWGR
jgi:hypothetical protein